MRDLIDRVSRGRWLGRPQASADAVDRTLEPAPFGPAGPWVAHFRANLAVDRAITWDDGYRLSRSERRAVGRSIAKFQLGGSSNGRFLQHHASLHARRAGDHAYAEAARLFIGEKQRHAAELGRFMDDQGLRKMRRHWSDSLFRCARKLGGLDLAISVLLTAELIALVYYQALGRATGSLVLRSICAEILRDERTHVVFQAGTLGRVRQGRSAGAVRFRVGVQRAFLLAAIMLVWVDHWRVFRAGRFGWRRYWHACWGAFGSVEALLAPRRRDRRDPAPGSAGRLEMAQAPVQEQRARDRDAGGHREER